MSSSLLQLVYRLSSELLLTTLGEDNGEGEDWLLGPASGGEDALAMAATKASGVSNLKEIAASLGTQSIVASMHSQ